MGAKPRREHRRVNPAPGFARRDPKEATGRLTIHDWQRDRDMWIRVLERQTGEGLQTWNRRIAAQRFSNVRSLRSWLAARDVSGYARSLLVMEAFGYPDYVRASADELIDQQYADRPRLKPICEAIIAASTALGDVTIQARKTFVSLLTPRRTFARVQPTTKTRLDLGLRLESHKAGGRLQPSRIHETMPLQVSLHALDDLDDRVREWLRQAYVENA
jgi:Domain of unknown function (DUF5655)